MDYDMLISGMLIIRFAWIRGNLMYTGEMGHPKYEMIPNMGALNKYITY